ncbi:deaminated glutathione amidase [Bordetella avium]|uniref:Hydrolase n=1 Tax=Bordetella avium (strain 197N) TaxID=360910 RepID=Q2L0W9_BORA1|nr:deaminated glutathione amidase [Bordetella avium]AZY49159.1 hydrolase [Bordetella avium]AZY52516.1 hydrolase [Bordetella avium]RIQ12307.1 deaminated glutathione amidase [Bordetella avium]RIQ19319.1 deaminated glutathione amidase [Bordetella avium]RIQ33487.1 deaminated glutathione amidase [Bordetella avium]
MKIAMGQFAVRPVWEENAVLCRELIERARAGGADALVLPEGVLARDITDPDLVKRSAQPIDGPFMSALLQASHGLTVFFCVHIPADDGKLWNVQFALRDGRIVAQYRKLHLYDAFNVQESINVSPGADIPPLVEVAGLKIGMMTCYDLRFPELARRLALDGADLLVAPSAWVRGPLKEMHWQVLCQARALENTCYVVATGECGPRNIGASMTVDPLGVIIARAAETDALVFVDIDPARIAQARLSLPVLQNRRFGRPELA